MEQFLQRDISQLSDQDLLRSRDQVVEQMSWARSYTLQLVESVPDDLWEAMPEGLATNLAWQVGHLAVAQYGLMLFRQRGRTPADLDLMPGWLRKKFGRGTTPAAYDDKPSRAELLEKLDAIHNQALTEAAEFTSESLREPTDMPYTAYPNKLGALLFCPIHESIHAGQIGTLRRLHGLEPIR